MGGLSVVCNASKTYLDLAERYNVDNVSGIDNTSIMSNDLLDKMSNKMSNKEKERFKLIVEYLQKNESITKTVTAKLLDVEDKTAQRLLTKAVELELLITEGEFKSTVYKINYD